MNNTTPKKMTKKQQYENSMARLRRIGEIARILEGRGRNRQYAFKVAKRFVQISM